MNKTVKNVLTAVGAVAVTVKAPVLVAGLVAGAVFTDPEKAKNTVKNGIDKTLDWVEDLLVKSGVPEEDLERVKDDVFGKEPETVEDLFSDDELFDETPTERGDWGAT